MEIKGLGGEQVEKKCEKCHKKVSHELFVCPHCGAILGQPLQEFKPLKQTKKPEQPKKSRNLPSLTWLGPVVMLVLVVMLAVYLPRYLKGTTPDPETTVTTDTITTPARIVTYHVNLESRGREIFKYILIEVYRDSNFMMACQTNETGMASFDLPESNDYQLRLVGLPIKYDLSYGDTFFSFAPGQRDLTITLSNLPVPYTVKVVNQKGEPLAGTGLCFWGTEEQSLVTGEDGCCTFFDFYQKDGYRVSFDFLSTGYTSQIDRYYFPDGTVELEITLIDIAETVPEGQQLYTVWVLDDYGQPVLNSWVSVYKGDPEQDPYNSEIIKAGLLNQDGCYQFIGEPDELYMISLPFLLDYSQIYFPFSEGSNELRIELDLEREEYIYTVQFVNQYRDPVPGVTIRYDNPATNQTEQYTSDAHGMITIASKEADPSNVSFEVSSFPDKYSIYYLGSTVLTFHSQSRSMTISLMYEGDIEHTVTLLDDKGNPIAGAEIEVQNGNISYYGTTDEQGCAKFMLSSIYYYIVRVISVPERYAYLQFGVDIVGNTTKEITLYGYGG